MSSDNILGALEGSVLGLPGTIAGGVAGADNIEAIPDKIHAFTHPKPPAAPTPPPSVANPETNPETASKMAKAAADQDNSGRGMSATMLYNAMTGGTPRVSKTILNAW
jgi:hypothetical protein